MLCYLLAWLGTTRWPWLQAVDDACGLLLVQLLLLLLLLLPLVEGTMQSPEDVDNRLNERCVSAQMSDRVADSTSSLGRASLCSDITARCEKRGACLLSASALSPRAL